MRSLRNKRAVSPVIATVILVAIAITVAVAVAFWIGGITGQYTRFEKIEITSAYCETETVNSTTYWKVSIDLRNTGTTESTVIGVFVNAKKLADFGGSPNYIRAFYNDTAQYLDFAAGGKLPITPGLSAKMLLYIQQGAPSSAYSFTSGTTIETSLHTGAGNNYMKMVTLT